MHSENSIMKRKLLDFIDKVHKEEQEVLDQQLEKCQRDLAKWTASGKEPYNFEVYLLNRMQEIEKIERAKKNLNEQMQIFSKNQETEMRITDLSDLCQQYGIRDYTKEKVKMNTQQLIKQFTSGIDQSYLAYKQNASIDRAIVKCKLKEKHLSKAEKKINEIIQSEREELSAKLQKKKKRRAYGLMQ